MATDPSFAVSASLTPLSSSPAPQLSVESQGLLDDARVVFAPRSEVVQETPVAAVDTSADIAVPTSLASLVAAHEMPKTVDKDLHCLAGAVYFEAKSEPLEGQLAVAEVVLNRAESGRFPRGLCNVVLQPSQFSFVRGGALPPINTTSRDWRKAVAVAEIALNDKWQSRASDALFFHATRVSPNWGKTPMVRLGNHVFYR